MSCSVAVFPFHAGWHGAARRKTTSAGSGYSTRRLCRPGVCLSHSLLSSFPSFFSHARTRSHTLTCHGGCLAGPARKWCAFNAVYPSRKYAGGDGDGEAALKNATKQTWKIWRRNFRTENNERNIAKGKWKFHIRKSKWTRRDLNEAGDSVLWTAVSLKAIKSLISPSNFVKWICSDSSLTKRPQK